MPLTSVSAETLTAPPDALNVAVSLGPFGTVAGCQLVAVFQSVEVVGDRQHQLDTRPRTSRFNEAEVTRRHADVEGEIELTASSSRPRRSSPTGWERSHS